MPYYERIRSFGVSEAWIVPFIGIKLIDPVMAGLRLTV
jgi:hypothetical protein